MSDPVSLSFGIISTLQVIACTTTNVYRFVKTCREARGDILGVSQELSAIKQVLEWLNSDTHGTQAALIPESLTAQILPIITKCNYTLSKIEALLQLHSSKGTGPLRWAMDGKLKIKSLQLELESLRDTLNLALVTVDIILTREIKDDTSVIRDDTAILKLGQDEILARIDELKAQLSQNIHRDSPIIQRYRDFATKSERTSLDSAEPEENRSLMEYEQQAIQKSPAEVDIPTTTNGKFRASKSSLSLSQQTSAIISNQPLLILGDVPIEIETTSALSSYQNHTSSSVATTVTPRRESSESLHVEQIAAKLSPVARERNQIPYEEDSNHKQYSYALQDTLRSRSSIGQSLGSEASDTTLSLQLSTTGSSIFSGSIMSGDSRTRARAILTLPSGDWYLGNTMNVSKTGKVKRIRNKSIGVTAVCKIISRPITGEQNPKHKKVRVANGAARILLLDHPFICSHLEVFQSKNNCYLILEHINGDNLCQYIARHERLKEQQARKYSRQILSALDYCHQHSVVHGNLRPEHLLVTPEGNLSLKGFARSNVFSPRGYLMSSTGKSHYSAPELLKDRNYSGPELDVWSFGAIVYHLVFGTVPFQGESVLELLASIMKSEIPVYTKDMGQGCSKHLVSRILIPNVSYRATLQEVMNHSWIREEYESQPSSHVPIREPLGLPLNDIVIRRMMGFNSASFDVIKAQLEQILKPGTYQAPPSRETPPLADGLTGVKRLMSLYKKNGTKIEVSEIEGLTEPSGEMTPNQESTKAMDPLVSMYYLAMERLNKDQDRLGE